MGVYSLRYMSFRVDKHWSNNHLYSVRQSGNNKADIPTPLNSILICEEISLFY